MTNRLWCGVPAALAVILALGGCGSGGARSATPAPGTSASATTAPTSPTAPTSARTSPGTPIGGGSVDLGGAAATYPPEQMSGMWAQDCYAGGDRIYDRAGITCADARSVVVAYEATAGAVKGAEVTVRGYRCSHNPQVMVVQGAPPAKCVDGQDDVVFGWRYPGAPQPAH